MSFAWEIEPEDVCGDPDCLCCSECCHQIKETEKDTEGLV
jgi:hypothetical protein